MIFNSFAVKVKLRFNHVTSTALDLRRLRAMASGLILAGNADSPVSRASFRVLLLGELCRERWRV